MTAGQPNTPTGAATADAVAGSWVDAWAPEASKPYLRLARMDRPIGTWLLLWPCWWSQALAELNTGASSYPNLWYLALFGIGAIAMRGAGCTYNDIVDRNIDEGVARTRSRPIPSGQVSLHQAIAFMLALCLVGLAVLVQFNTFAIWLGFSSVGLIAIYPFMKRYTYWPQAVLGLTFKWGALMGWAVVYGALSVAAVLLYAGCVCWTIGYDTIYAHQDKEDDEALGLKSTALKFGANTARWIAGFYVIALAMFTGAAVLCDVGLVVYLALAGMAAHFVWQVTSLEIDDADNCLRRFRSNRDVGWLFFAGLVADMGLRTIAG